MTGYPLPLSASELTLAATDSAALFRAQRLAMSNSWAIHYEQAREKFELLFQSLNDLNPGAMDSKRLADAYGLGLGEALRYLAGPPISDDDLQVIADVESIAPNALKKRPNDLRKIAEVIERIIDPQRFPWILKGRPPTARQREAALLASSVLLAAQRIATERRNDSKQVQESKVKDYLRSIGFAEVASNSIRTIVQGPGEGHFSPECQLGDRKADVVLRLHDTRLMAIECKVSNSATNSVKRLNNDAAVKSEYWLKLFGTSQVVPAAMLAGVFKVLNLAQAQERGLALFWSHDLERLGRFIDSTR